MLDKPCSTLGCGNLTHGYYCVACNEAELARSMFPEAPDPPKVFAALGIGKLTEPGIDESDEAHVQKTCVEFLRLAGWWVYVIGQHNARRTQTPGIADSVNFHPERYTVWVEYKGPDGKQSDAQAEFQRAVESAGGIYWLVHSRAELLGHLAGLP